jgi:hypothetical protein
LQPSFLDCSSGLCNAGLYAFTNGDFVIDHLGKRGFIEEFSEELKAI